jgi:hypothetical protein
MKFLSFLLNLPWTIVGLIAAIASIPYRNRLNKSPLALIIYVQSFWWYGWYAKGVRGMAVGNIILLGPKELEKDLEHELIHVEQYEREPFIHPFLYIWQSFRHGYERNKYEIEAYQRSGNVYLK